MSAPVPVLAGESEVAAIIEVMRSEALSADFIDLMDGPDDHPYEGAARIAVINPEYMANRTEPKWIDGAPIYPDAPDARRFFGNFANLSHVFTIDLADAGLIDRMRAAIRDNIDCHPELRDALARVQGGA